MKVLMPWLLALGVGLAPAAAAQERNPHHLAAADTFALNNAIHVLYHEIGHLFIDQFDLPVLGKEEDAVDMLATLMMLEDSAEVGDAPLVDAVEGWLYSERTRPESTYSNADFYGAHSLDIQRSFTIACLIIGSDYDKHNSFATRLGLPVERQTGCAEDYTVAQKSWSRVLAPFARRGSPGADVSVAYRPAGPYGKVAALLQSNRVLERAGERMLRSYVLPQPVFITAEICGEVNAFYDPSNRKVMLCYEWVDFFHNLFLDFVLSDRLQAEKEAKRTEAGALN